MKIKTHPENPLLAAQPRHSLYHQEAVQSLLRRVLPPAFLENPSVSALEKKAFLQERLPFVQWNEKKEGSGFVISVILLGKYRLGASNFFYDMMSRWLVPFQRLNIDLFFSSDFSLPELSEEAFTIAEVGIYLKEEKLVQKARESWKTLETELRLGVISSYHASRILEFKSLSSDGKTAMIQEKIGSLMQNRSRDFDKSIFSQMQRFLVNCHDEFKSIRDYHHISRIISILYLIRKLLYQKCETIPNERHVILKLLKTKLVLPKKEKQVLGVLVGMNLLGDYEIFEEEHFFKAIQNYLPNAQPVEGSFLIDRGADKKIQTLYLEIEKKEGNDFSLEEIHSLRQHLPDHLKGSIERLMHPIFMPRNEEEILRNIMALSRQLKYVRDLPQVIISFEEQKQEELNFTVIFLRILGPQEVSATQILEQIPLEHKVKIDRTRKVGALRRKYAKEAVVFRISMPSKKYLRKDHSIDLYKARQDVIGLLQPLFGEVRDYNGGMILKESQLLSALKSSLGTFGKKQELLLEKFFYSIFPVEMRSVLEVEPLKQLFLLLVQGIKKESSYFGNTPNAYFKEEPKRASVVVFTDSLQLKKHLTQALHSLKIPSYQLISFAIDSYKAQGYLLLSEDKEKKRQFFSAVQRALDF